jgi:16S rRNA (cytidine1402-2'-O)-methyltransferase
MLDNFQPGILYLVGTPIGNLEDITLRAIRILKEADLIAAEDTRRTGKLLQHLQISTPLISYYEHNHNSRISDLVARIYRGENVALVSDAGMPSISDPGYKLVRAAIDAKIEIVPIPGGTAAIGALAVSGLPTDRFMFEGFLPVKSQQRQAYLGELQHETRTLIFYEAPHRLLAMLKDLQVVLGNRDIVLARELTKIHEEIWRGSIISAIALYSEERQPKGEYTLVVSGAKENKVLVMGEVELKQELQQLLRQGMTRSQASRHLAEETTFSRRELYRLSLEIEDVV